MSLIIGGVEYGKNQINQKDLTGVFNVEAQNRSTGDNQTFQVGFFSNSMGPLDGRKYDLRVIGQVSNHEGILVPLEVLGHKKDEVLNIFSSKMSERINRLGGNNLNDL